MSASAIKVINGKLKRRAGSKYQKEASLSQYQQYANDYCQATLCEVGLTQRSNIITVTDPRSGESKQAEQFSPTTKMHVSKKGYVQDLHGISILYTNHKGQIYWATNDQGKESEFRRFRFATGLEWENAKYLTDPGSGYFVFLNPIYQNFYTQGVKRLKRVYGMEGEKKATAAGINGIPAIGAGGIHLFVKTKKSLLTGKTIDAEFLPELKQFFTEYGVEEFVYIHDQDALDNLNKPDRAASFYASIRNMWYACQKLGIKLIYKHIADSAPGKGLDDIINANRSKVDEIKKALATDNHTAYFKSFVIDERSLKKIARYILSSVNEEQADLQLRVEKYTSEKLEQIFRIWNTYQMSALTARTGTGKTDIAYRYAWHKLNDSSFSGRIFFCYHNNLANEQKASQYTNSKSNPSGLELDICVYNQYTSQEEKQFVGQRRIINCHASRLQEFAPGKDDIIIYDEAHKGFIDNFADTEENLEYILSCGAKTIFLTGTEFREFYKSHNIYEIEVLRAQSPKVSINYTELTRKGKTSFNIAQSLNIYASEAEYYVKQIDPEDEQVYIIFIQSIDRINQLSKILSDRGIDIALLYSDDDIKENSEIWQSLVTTGTIPTNGNPLVVLTTPLLYESADVKNTNIGRVAIFGERWGHNIRQIAGRFRNCDQVEIDYFLTSADTKKGYYKSYQTYRQEHFSDFEGLRKIYDELNKLITIKEAEEAAKFQQQQKYFVESNKFLRQDGRFNEFCCVRNWIRQRNEWLSNVQRIDELRRYFAVTDHGTREVSSSEIEDQQEAGKAKKKTDQYIAFNKVRDNVQFALHLITTSKVDAKLRRKAREQLLAIDSNIEQDPDFKKWYEGIDRSIRKEITKVVSKYLYLTSYMTGDKGMLDIVERNYTEFNSNVKQQLAILYTLHAKKLSPVDKVNRYLYQRVINQFEIGERYSPKEIKEAIDDSFAEYKHLKVPGKNHTHFFRMLFHAKRDREGRYIIMEKMSLQAYCKQCDTSAYNIDSIEMCHTVTKHKKMECDTSPCNISITQMCNTQKDIHLPGNDCPF